MTVAHQASSDVQYIARLVARLSDWYRAWSPIPEYVPLQRKSIVLLSFHRLGTSMINAYNLAFQTHVYSVLPASFTQGFKALVTLTFNLTHDATGSEWLFTLFPKSDRPSTRVDLPLWNAFQQLGLSDRYESLISSICYEYVEGYILKTCAQKWDEPMLSSIRSWMADKIVPWMIMPFARGARNCKDTRNTKLNWTEMVYYS